MKTEITLVVEIEHTKDTSIETIKECLTTGLKETYTNEMEVVDVYFYKDTRNRLKQITESFIDSLGIDGIEP